MMTSTKFLAFVWAPAILVGLFVAFCPSLFVDQVVTNRHDALFTLFVVYTIAVIIHFVCWRRHELNMTMLKENKGEME